jgi:beta-lactam-binding protein with PASTA domain
MAYEGAQTLLRRAGFNADRVSFAPADESQAGAVLETIPGPGEDVEVGSGVHIVAGAAPVTPAPSIAPVNEGREERGENGRGNGRKDKDDD